MSSCQKKKTTTRFWRCLSFHFFHYRYCRCRIRLFGLLLHADDVCARSCAFSFLSRTHPLLLLMPRKIQHHRRIPPSCFSDFTSLLTLYIPIQAAQNACTHHPSLIPSLLPPLPPSLLTKEHTALLLPPPPRIIIIACCCWWSNPPLSTPPPTPPPAPPNCAKI